MIELKLVESNDPILTMTMPAVGDDVDLTQLSKDMFMVMWSNGGIGLSAPQVGMALRMFVMGSQQGPNYVCINPEVLDTSADLVVAQEGCLSYPALWLNIKRPSWVQAQYRTLNGKLIEQRFEGLLARCYLHELDHLNGTVFINYAGKLSLKMALARQRKKLKGQNESRRKQQQSN